MNELRLILLLAGIGLVLGLYLWGSYQQREHGRRRTVVPDVQPFASPGARERPAIPLLEETGEDAPIRALEDPDLPPPRIEPPPAPDAPSGAAPQPGGLITLHVAAAPGRTFSGRAILEAMRAADLRYGPMKIFHRYRGGSPGTPVFSVADMFEPGVFDLDAMDEYTTRGLSLFMEASAPAEAVSAFDEMLSAAEALAGRLGGDVLDAGRRTLDANRIAAIRTGLEA